MALLNKDAILAVQDRTYRDVEINEWGGTVRLRSMSGAQRDKFESDTVEYKNGKAKENFENLRARLVALCAVDEDDRLLFPNAIDVKALGNKAAGPLNKLWEEARKLNGMSSDDVEELVEDFENVPSEDSPSD